MQLVAAYSTGGVVLACLQVSITFKNQQVLKDCTWEVKKGERVGLVGECRADRQAERHAEPAAAVQRGLLARGCMLDARGTGVCQSKSAVQARRTHLRPAGRQGPTGISSHVVTVRGWVPSNVCGPKQCGQLVW